MKLDFFRIKYKLANLNKIKRRENQKSDFKPMHKNKKRGMNMQKLGENC